MSDESSLVVIAFDGRGAAKVWSLAAYPVAMVVALLAWVLVGPLLGAALMVVLELAMALAVSVAMRYLSVRPDVRIRLYDKGWRVSWSRAIDKVMPSAVLIGGLWGAVLGLTLALGLYLLAPSLDFLLLGVLWLSMVLFHVTFVLGIGTGRLLSGHLLIHQRMSVMSWGFFAQQRAPVDEIKSVRIKARGITIEDAEGSRVALDWIERRDLEPVMEQLVAAVRTLGGIKQEPWRG